MISFTHKNYFKTAILMGCFFMYSCENSMEEVQALGIKRASQEVAENVESYMSQDGKVRAKLTAPLMLRTEGDKQDTPLVEFPKTLHVDFYGDSTKLESRLFAKYGRYLERQGKVFLRDSVVVFNVKGDTLFTSELWWDREKQIFYTEKYVIIKKPFGQKLEGKNGMNADQSFKNWELINASGIQNIADSSMPVN